MVYLSLKAKGVKPGVKDSSSCAETWLAGGMASSFQRSPFILAKNSGESTSSSTFDLAQPDRMLCAQY